MSTTIKDGFVPLFERVLIKPDPVEKKTASGITLAVESRKRPNTGVIIALGHLAQSVNSKMPVEEGNRVLYQRYSGLDIDWEGVNYHLVMANDLLAVINKDEATSFELNEDI